jgi:hypothetical protein
VEGSYSADAKVIMWNGAAPVGGTDESQCQVHSGNITQVDGFPVHVGFVGFKIYRPTQSCCDICSRLSPYCGYWASPALGITSPTTIWNDCELFFAQGTPKDIIPKSQFVPESPFIRKIRDKTRSNILKPDAYYHGAPHKNPTAYFVGCGWSSWFTLDFPCLSADLDDRIYMAKSAFNFKVTQDKNSPGLVGKAFRSRLPLCTIENEDVDRSKGRWVREQRPDTTVCPMPMQVDKNFKSRFDIMKIDRNRIGMT